MESSHFFDFFADFAAGFAAFLAGLAAGFLPLGGVFVAMGAIVPSTTPKVRDQRAGVPRYLQHMLQKELLQPSPRREDPHQIFLLR